jgi:uncharacterized membrane protein
MTILTALDYLTLADLLALVGLLLGWFGIGWLIEHPSSTRPSVSVLMDTYRHAWMQQMLTREPRIFDSQMVGQMRQGTAFFASATMLAIGGGMALIGNTEPLRSVAHDLTQRDDPPLIWEIKLILLVLMIASAFLRYVWAHRLFGYTAVLMSAVPNDPNHEDAVARARQAGDVCVLASRAFTRGMRTTYFALASAAWLLGPSALILATLATLAMLWRREFASDSRAALLSNTSKT